MASPTDTVNPGHVPWVGGCDGGQGPQWVVGAEVLHAEKTNPEPDWVSSPVGLGTVPP